DPPEIILDEAVAECRRVNRREKRDEDDRYDGEVTNLLASSCWTSGPATRRSISSSVREGIDHGVNPERVPVGAEVHEVRRIVALALPRIPEVRVVRHQHDHAALLVGDAARVRHGAVGAALGGAAASEEEID